MPEPAVPDAAVRLHRALLARGETVAAAESLTAGPFCATLATVPGASATLRGGVVVYATDLKTALAGVAGPDPVDGHSPGRVHLGISDGRRTDVVELDLAGDRAAVRAGAVAAAMDGLLARLG